MPKDPLFGDVMLVDPKRESRGDFNRVIRVFLLRLWMKKQKPTAHARIKAPIPAAIPAMASRLSPCRVSKFGGVAEGVEIVDVVVTVDTSPGNVITTVVFEKRSPWRPMGSLGLGR